MSLGTGARYPRASEWTSSTSLEPRSGQHKTAPRGKQPAAQPMGDRMAPARQRRSRQPSAAVQRNTAAASSTGAAHANVQAGASDAESACYAGLRAAGVSFETVPKQQASGVHWPIKLRGPIAGIEVIGGTPNVATNYLDCSLAQALLAWSPALSRAGVVGLQHYSMFRKDAKIAGTSKVSGHAHGTAIDVAKFVLRDGTVLSVLDDWSERSRGEDPCHERSHDTSATRLMRGLVCRAAADDVFQTVLTPHYNDAHRNHVHLEVSANGDRRFVG